MTTTPVTSVTVGSRWHGDNRTTRGRIVRVVHIHTDLAFDPYLDLEIEDPGIGSGRAGDRVYSRASWLQTFYRPDTVAS